jgi:hypothetical protein
VAKPALLQMRMVALVRGHDIEPITVRESSVKPTVYKGCWLSYLVHVIFPASIPGDELI